MVTYIKGGMQAKGILKHDPEANIWVQIAQGRDYWRALVNGALNLRVP